MQEGDLTIQVI